MVAIASDCVKAGDKVDICEIDGPGESETFLAEKVMVGNTSGELFLLASFKISGSILEGEDT